MEDELRLICLTGLCLLWIVWKTVEIIRIRDDLKSEQGQGYFCWWKLLEFNATCWERRSEALSPWEISYLPAAEIGAAAIVLWFNRESIHLEEFLFRGEILACLL